MGAVTALGESLAKEGSLYAGWVDEAGPNAVWPALLSMALA